MRYCTVTLKMKYQNSFSTTLFVLALSHSSICDIDTPFNQIPRHQGGGQHSPARLPAAEDARRFSGAVCHAILSYFCVFCHVYFVLSSSLFFTILCFLHQFSRFWCHSSSCASSFDIITPTVPLLSKPHLTLSYFFALIISTHTHTYQIHQLQDADEWYHIWCIAPGGRSRECTDDGRGPNGRRRIRILPDRQNAGSVFEAGQ